MASPARLRTIGLANGATASYRCVGYRDLRGRFVTRNPGNGQWWAAKARGGRGHPPSSVDLDRSDVVNWEVRYGRNIYYFSSDGGVRWAGDRGAARSWNTDDLIRDFLDQQLRPEPRGGPHRRKTPIVIQNPDGSVDVLNV